MQVGADGPLQIMNYFSILTVSLVLFLLGCGKNVITFSSLQQMIKYG